MAKPLVSVLLTGDMVDACFRPTDLERLAEACELRCTRPEKITDALKVELARDADGWISGWGTGAITPAMLDAAPNVKLMVHAAGSTRTMIPEEFWSRGVRLSTTNDALGRGVAEYTLGLMLVTGKRVWQLAQLTREGQWKVAEEVARMKEPFDVTVGIISASRVGRHLLRLLETFDVDILLYDPFVTADEASRLGATKVELDDLCCRSDFFICCAPSLPETAKLIGPAQFAAMQDDCVIINTSRGAVFDEPAMIAELEKGRFFTCIDVTDPEPPAADSPLRSLPNVILTPHIAGHSNNARRRQGRDAVAEVLAFFTREPMRFEVTADMHTIMA